MSTASKRSMGISAAIATYTIWGVLPLFFKLLQRVPTMELVGWRIIFTLPVCLILIAALGKWEELRAAVANRALLFRLGLSALLVGANWVIYVSAVNAGHVLAASLGYYIIPLINVLLGTVLLGERLGRLQWAAVVIAAVGIALLASEALDTLTVAVTLGTSFALYGYVRKITPVGAVPGLTIEAAWLIIPAISIAAWFGAGPPGSSMTIDLPLSALIASTGIITAVPLLLFAIAARELDLTTLGFAQFLSPTMGFLLGHFVYGEPLNQASMACFVLIWIALALFCWDMLQKARMNSHTKSPA